MGFEHSFFKVVKSSEKMEVPPAFAVAKRCILRDDDNNMWQVEVAAQDDKWYFREGWADLYREKSLNLGNILSFEYMGDNSFRFKLFGEGACEPTVKEEELELDESNNLGGGVQEEGEHQESEDDDNDDDDDDYVKEEEDDDDDGYENDDDDYVKEEEDDDAGEYARKDEQIHISKKIKPESHQSNTTIGAETLPSKRRYTKHNVPDCYGEEIFKSGLASRPDNPYFVSRSRILLRKNELYIPKDVIVDYHLNIPEKMYIADERGRKWETKMKQWKDGRVWCTKGWKNLRKVNNIKLDDICICEFQGCNTDMSLLIHVVDK